MKKKTYLKIFSGIKSFRYGICCIYIAQKVLTYVTAFIYTICIAYTLLNGTIQETAGLIIVPAVSFLLLSLFRTKYNAPRPYEVYDFKPLIKKDTKGKSFPSRHVFSIFVIGSSIASLYYNVGTVIMLMGLILAAIRVITGVHFIKDVTVGAIIGYICGLAVRLF